MNAGDAAISTAKKHIEQNDFSSRNNELHVGDMAVSELMERSKGRPFYAYDRSIMSRNVEKLRRALPERISLHYAMKANPMPEVVRHISAATKGIDVASAFELRTALSTGIAPRDISFAGPGKSQEDLDAAVRAGVIIVIESELEAQRVSALANSSGVTVPVAIRVNPDFQLKASGMKMGGGSQPFGVDAEKIPLLLRNLATEPLEILGFHIFSGSQNLRPESIIDAQRQTLELAERLAPGLPGPLRWLNIGGGLGVPYFPGDQPLDLEPIMSELQSQLTRHAELLQETEVVMELGRFLVANAGIYVCQVIDKKESRGKTYLVTNGGLHHHLAVTGNFGQVIRKNYPVAIANRITDDDLEQVTIVGPLCTPLDLLGQEMLLPKARVGDLIAIYMSGAYGYTASPHQFLSHPEPAEFCL